MNRSMSGTISEKAFSSPNARVALSRRELMLGSSQVQAWFTGTGSKLW
jgi:hypothetical protein